MEEIVTNTLSHNIQCDTTLWTRPFKCAVPSCKNIFTRYDPKAITKYHNFPTDLEFKQLWLKRCCRQLDFNVDTAKVCMIHFLPNDYEETNVTNTKVLKSIAVPTQFLVIENDFPQKAEKQKVIDENFFLKQTYNQLLAENEANVKKFSNLEKQRLLKEKRLKILKKQYEEMKTFEHCNDDKNLLCRVFSQSQINILLNKKRVIWSNDDMAMAFTLRQMGNRESYLYLKHVLNFPLPSLSSVQKWAASK